MTEQEFINTNWQRGNIVKLKNGKEYLVKGRKGHGRYLLLYSSEYNACFIADHHIVDCRTSDYEEPEEVYLEHRRKMREEAEARREAEKQEYLRAKAELKQRNILEQERIHQKALARKAIKAVQKNDETTMPKVEPKPVVKAEPVVEVKPIVKAEPVVKSEAVVKSEPNQEQPKRKRQRIRISHVEKVKIK